MFVQQMIIEYSFENVLKDILYSWVFLDIALRKYVHFITRPAKIQEEKVLKFHWKNKKY